MSKKAAQESALKRRSRGVEGAKESAIRRLEGGRVSVADLVGGLVADGISRDDAVSAVVGLQRERRVALQEEAPYAGILAYARSPLSLWYWASLAAVAAAIALVSVTAGVLLDLRYVFGGALVLVIPGYAVVEALYPKPELDGLTRLALSIGMSLALVPLVALVLNYTPLGVRLLPVTLSLAGVSVLMLTAALARRHGYYRLARGVA